MALGASISLWAGNTITYTASAKLDEKTSSVASGMHINAFGVSITSHTFANDTGVVTFSGDVTSIGRAAFSASRNLTSITIPDGVTSIGYTPVYDCSGLTSLEIPSSVTSIETVAFAGCENLTSLTIPEGVTSIESQTFQNCYALTSVTIPSSVTSIATMAFYNCTALASITLPDSLTSIGLGAFSGCSALTSLTIPSSVTNLGMLILVGCSGLTSITAEGVNPPVCESACFSDVDTSIPLYVPAGSVAAYQAAEGWQDFTNILPIPGTVGMSAVITYTALSKLIETSEESSVGLHTYAFGASITNHSFADNTGTISFASDINSIGDYAFYLCRDMTSITIPQGIINIGNYAFCDCSGLISVTIPNGVTSIGTSAFYGCSGLTSITAEGVSPAACGENSFGDIDKSIPLYVPAGSVAAYQSAEGWQDFTNILPIGSIATEVSVATAAPESNLRKDLFQGKVYITRDGHTYTILGTRVK